MFEVGLFTGAVIHFILVDNYLWAGISFVMVMLSIYGLRN